MSESRKRKLKDTYKFPGFRPDPTICGVFGDPKAGIIRLIRRFVGGGGDNKMRVIQRRAYGLRDQEYLRLKILTCMLPAI